MHFNMISKQTRFNFNQVCIYKADKQKNCCAKPRVSAHKKTARLARGVLKYKNITLNARNYFKLLVQRQRL